MCADNVFPFERRVPPSPPRDFDTADALRKCRLLLQTLGRYDLAEESCEACVLMLLVNLHDLLQLARGAGSALTFDEHIDPDAGVANVTELVAKLRNAACHVWGRANSGYNAFRFHRVAGYCPRATLFQSKPIGCDYHDDMAIYYGTTRLYLKRHATRALDELDRLFAQEP
jgi:hypothetical protein